MRTLGELDKCIKNGFIRRIEPSKNAAQKMIEKAAELLKEADKSSRAGAPNGTLLIAYDVMLFAGKALLALDGFREKNHYCVAIYVKEEYADKGKIGRETAKRFDEYRVLRQMVAYDADFMVSTVDAKQSIKDASNMLEEVRKQI